MKLRLVGIFAVLAMGLSCTSSVGQRTETVSEGVQDPYASSDRSVWQVAGAGSEGAGEPRGSAVAVAPGRLLTSCVVTGGADRVILRKDDTQLGARVAERHAAQDLCVLEVQGVALEPVRAFRPQVTVRRGEAVFALGHVAAGAPVVADGEVVGSTASSRGGWIQTSIPPSAETVGGGLFDLEAHLIGIISQPRNPAGTTGVAAAVDHTDAPLLAAIPERQATEAGYVLLRRRDSDSGQDFILIDPVSGLPVGEVAAPPAAAPDLELTAGAAATSDPAGAGDGGGEGDVPAAADVGEAGTTSTDTSLTDEPTSVEPAPPASDPTGDVTDETAPDEDQTGDAIGGETGTDADAPDAGDLGGDAAEDEGQTGTGEGGAGSDESGPGDAGSRPYYLRTTAAPVTPAQVTAAPATVVPTEAAPATAAPEATAAPTTAAPTGAAPATVAPGATAAPMTAAPTGAAPATAAPGAIAAPTTAAPTTAAPMGAAPATAVPGPIAAPMTAVPTGAAPVTAAPGTTAAPTTAAPMTAAPTGAAPATAAPGATAAPTGAAPVMADPGATAAPTTAAPMTAAPTGAAPATAAPGRQRLRREQRR